MGGSRITSPDTVGSVLSASDRGIVLTAPGVDLHVAHAVLSAVMDAHAPEGAGMPSAD